MVPESIYLYHNASFGSSDTGGRLRRWDARSQVKIGLSLISAPFTYVTRVTGDAGACVSLQWQTSESSHVCEYFVSATTLKIMSLLVEVERQHNKLNGHPAITTAWIQDDSSKEVCAAIVDNLLANTFCWPMLAGP